MSTEHTRVSRKAGRRYETDANPLAEGIRRLPHGPVETPDPGRWGVILGRGLLDLQFSLPTFSHPLQEGGRPLDEFTVP
jgi:hypothetical protein